MRLRFCATHQSDNHPQKTPLFGPPFGSLGHKRQLQASQGHFAYCTVVCRGKSGVGFCHYEHLAKQTESLIYRYEDLAGTNRAVLVSADLDMPVCVVGSTCELSTLNKFALSEANG
jgi:hypothetical protein